MNPTEQRTYISKPKTEAGIRKIPIVPEVRKALDEVKQYQYENGISVEQRLMVIQILSF